MLLSRRDRILPRLMVNGTVSVLIFPYLWHGRLLFILFSTNIPYLRHGRWRITF